MFLNHRVAKVSILTSGKYAPGASYTVTAYAPGTRIASDSSGTTLTVDDGHAIKANDKIMLGTDVTTYRTVSAATQTSLTINSAVTATTGTTVVNLGADTGALTPSYDGSPIAIYSTNDDSTVITSSRVTANSQGEYEYFHRGEAFWELWRTTTGTPTEIIMGVGNGTPGEYNICDFGASPDKADNSTYIQASIAAATNSGGCIFVPTGTFLTAALTVYNNVSIAGEGYGSIIKSKSGVTTLVTFADETVTPLRRSFVRGVQFDGDAIATTVVYLGNISSIHLYDVSIKNASATALSTLLVLDDTQNSQFDDLLLHTSQRGLLVANGSSNNVFTRLQITNCDEQHLHMALDSTLPNYSISEENRANQFNLFQVERDRAGNSIPLVAANMVHLTNAFYTVFVACHSDNPADAGRGWYLETTSVVGTRLLGCNIGNRNAATAGIEIDGALDTVLIAPHIALNAPDWLVTDERTVVLFPTADSGLNLDSNWTDNGAANENKSLVVVRDLQSPYDFKWMINALPVMNMNYNTVGVGVSWSVFGVAAAARPTAYTQTYATADKTHAAMTSADLAINPATQTTPWGFSSQANAESIQTQFNLLRDDLEDLKQLVNSVVDDLQTLGILQ